MIVAVVTLSGALMAQNDQTLPQLIVWNLKSLQGARDALSKNNSELQPAYQELLREADQALAIQRLSVVDKTGPVPSGDPHDYVSIGIYWWPNPDTPSGLPYVRKDGERNPEAGNDTFDARRTNQMSRHVQTLALAWFFSGEEKYAQHAVHLLRVFFIDEKTRMNPNLNYAQAIPGISEGRGIGIIETAEWVYLVDAISVLSHSEAWQEPVSTGINAWFNDYLNWLLNSKNGLSCRLEPNNIGVWYDNQVIAYALFSQRNEFAAQYYRDVALPRAIQLIQPDGQMPMELQRTRSWSYTMYSLRALGNLARMSRLLGEDLVSYLSNDGRSLRKAFEYPLRHMQDLEAWPHQQIGGGLGNGVFGQVGADAVNWYGRETYQYICDLAQRQVSPKARVRLLYPELFRDLGQD